MASNRTRAKTNGDARRRCHSWIDHFIRYTDDLESAEVFRKWTAIGVIAAALEQKVWAPSDRLFPNLYTILVGLPGVGKTRAIMRGRRFLAELPELRIAPTSMKMASLVDSLAASKRTMIGGTPSTEFNSMTLVMDEWSAFMHAYDEELVAGLTTFYDAVPYDHWRRVMEIKIKIPSPMLNILAGTTPDNLARFMPAGAWGQGFASRVIFVYSDERSILDDFAQTSRPMPEEMIHDLRTINGLEGEFVVTQEFRDHALEWKKGLEKPQPTHPKLVGYNSRRRAHIYKLAMICAVDQGNELILTGKHWRDAQSILQQAEETMPLIFSRGIATADAAGMDEIVEYVRRSGTVTQPRLWHEASLRVPIHSVQRVLSLLQLSGRIKQIGIHLWAIGDEG